MNLGADYATEHELGIGDLKMKLGVSKSGVGLEIRKVKDASQVVWYEGNDFVGIHTQLIKNYSTGNHYQFHERGRVDSTQTCPGLYAGWDSGSFYVMAKLDDKKTIKHLKALYEAFQNNDVCMWLGGGGVFKNAGLCFGIISRMPKEVFEQWIVYDKDLAEKAEWLESTGIHALLEKADKKWYSLKTVIINEDKTRKIWLNPMEQSIYNWGWFTIDELKQWAQDKGPVVKTSEQKRREY